jgi:hypothetical protein
MLSDAGPTRPIALLLAALTLALGLLPPALGHAHDLGDRPHRHDLDHHHDHDRAHHDHRHASPDHDDAHDDGQAGPHRASSPTGPAIGRLATAHLHIDLGAFGLTIPTPSEPPDGPGRPTPDDPAIGAADDETIPARIEASPFTVPWPGSLVVARVDAAPPVLPSVLRFAAARGTSPPLCDAARHERSGVLLI